MNVYLMYIGLKRMIRILLIYYFSSKLLNFRQIFLIFTELFFSLEMGIKLKNMGKYDTRMKYKIYKIFVNL